MATNEELLQDLQDLTHIVLRLLIERRGKCLFCSSDGYAYHSPEDCFGTRTINRILRHR